MFNMSRSYLYETGSTYCPNQELGDAKGVWAANHAVALLEPALAWSEDEALDKVVLPALGLANWSTAMWHAKFGPNVTIPAGNWVEISPAGISLEWGGSLSGGYSAGYSDILGDVDTWAAWAQAAGENRTYEALKDVLLRMAPAFANFRLPATCHDQISSTGKATAAYRCLKNTAFITYRNKLVTTSIQRRNARRSRHIPLLFSRSRSTRERFSFTYSGLAPSRCLTSRPRAHTGPLS
eukprot:COSAG06_NODE_7033_length_2664_cov_5.945711_3_plen_238_part_00